MIKAVAGPRSPPESLYFLAYTFKKIQPLKMHKTYS